jgi:hypothetical protein
MRRPIVLAVRLFWLVSARRRARRIQPSCGQVEPRLRSWQPVVDDLQKLAALHHLQVPCAMWYGRNWCEHWLSGTGLGAASEATERVLAVANQSASVNCSCALVSTSGALLKQEEGPHIDTADLVIRIGTAPVDGYERHVGNRTDLRYLHASTYAQYIRNLTKNTPLPTLVWMFEDGRLASLQSLREVLGARAAEKHLSPLLQIQLSHFKRNRTREVRTLQSAMCRYVGKRKCENEFYKMRVPFLYEVKFLLGLHSHQRGYAPDGGFLFGEGQMASTGLVALHHLLSRGVCSSVQLFGFEDSKSDVAVPYHYYTSGAVANITVASHYAARKQAGKYNNHPGWEPFDWALTQRMGHNFVREHDVLRAVSRSTWRIDRADYLRHLAGTGFAWERLATSGGSSEPEFWRQHVRRQTT